MPTHPNLDCSPTTSPILKPSVFLAYISVLQTDVHHWEGRSLDTDALLRFGACSPGDGSRWHGRWMVEVLIVVQHTNIVDNVYESLMRKSVNVELLGPELYGT